MNSNELLDIIGEAREEYVFAAKQSRTHRTVRRPLLIAAVIVLILALVGCGVAYVLSLNDLKMDEDIWVPNGDTTEETAARAVISMQGYMGSNGYQAAKEFYDFCQSYDYDSEEMLEPIPDDYVGYACYTQTMMDKIDEICAKYDLNLKGRIFLENTVVDTLKVLGVGSVFEESAQIEVYDGSSYYYRDGTFEIESMFRITADDALWTEQISYTFRCVRKTTFDDVCAFISDAESYDQWTYTDDDGMELLLACTPDTALLIADREDYFITVFFDGPYFDPDMSAENDMTREALEYIADQFDLTFTIGEVDEEAALKREEERYAAYQKSQETWENSDANPKNQKDIVDYIGYLRENEPGADSLYCGLYDLNGDSTYELLVGNSETSIGQVVQFLDGKAEVNTFGFMEGMYLCENGVVEKTNPTQNESDARFSWFSEYTDSGRNALDCIVYAPEKDSENPWFRSPTGSMISWDLEPITEEEYNRVRETYVRMEIQLKPISYFSEQTMSDGNAALAGQKSSEEYGYQEFIADRIQALEHPEELYYVLTDIDQNGVVDLLLGSSVQCETIWTIAYDEMAGYEHMNFVWLTEEERSNLDEDWPNMEKKPITEYSEQSTAQEEDGYDGYMFDALATAKHPENIFYALKDVDGNGVVDLLYGSREILDYIWTVEYSKNGYPSIKLLSYSFTEEEWNTWNTAWPDMEKKPITEYFDE